MTLGVGWENSRYIIAHVHWDCMMCSMCLLLKTSFMYIIKFSKTSIKKNFSGRFLVAMLFIQVTVKCKPSY